MTLRTRGLRCVYDDLVAVRDVSVELRAGAITAILGPNAAGKSTLLAAMIGAVRPAAGVVELDGRAVHRLRPRTVAGRIAYVPQRSSVAAAFTVEQVVRLGRYALPPDDAAVGRALARLKLTDLADRLYEQLSVGQQQRVTLARALAQLGPGGHLVLDEPMSAMDLAHVADVAGLLRQLADDGATVVVAMHDLPLAAAMADEVVLLRDGGLVAHGPTPQTLTEARLEEVFGVAFRAVHVDGEGSILAPEAWMRAIGPSA